MGSISLVVEMNQECALVSVQSLAGARYSLHTSYYSYSGVWIGTNTVASLSRMGCLVTHTL